MTIDEIGLAFIHREVIEVDHQGTWLDVYIIEMRVNAQPNATYMTIQWYAADRAISDVIELDMKNDADMFRKKTNYRIVWSI